MIVGIGVDVVDLPRFTATLERTPGVRDRLFLPAERERSTESLAARFAAKEAFVKAVRTPQGLSWHDVEIVSEADGAPSLRLHGAAKERAADLGVASLHLSLSHDTAVATAFVVAES